MEVFQNMWFTPIRERPTLDSAALIRKVMNITDVVAASRDMGLEWFEQLLLSVSIYTRNNTVLQHSVALYAIYC
jgi:cohesin loading factor subunit SCC2